MSEDFERYRGLCQALVRRFLRAGTEREDLEQVAALGLVKALRRYVGTKGVPFASYAWYIICGELLHYVRDHERSVRMPRALWELERREHAVENRLALDLARQPKLQEIALELGVTAEVAGLLQRGPLQTTRLSEYVNIQPCEKNSNLYVREMLAALPVEERTMILGVYFCGFSQTEIGARLGYPQRRASRLHARAIRRLAHVLGERIS